MACRIIEYGEDTILIGPGLNPRLYNEIRATLPKVEQKRLIGWRRTNNYTPEVKVKP